MTEIQASRATQASLQAPFEIRHSLVALIFISVFVTFSLGLFSVIVGAMLSMPAEWPTMFTKAHATGNVVLIVMELLSIWLFYTRVLRPWLNFRKPIITISLAGIAIRAEPVLPWREITENRIRTIYSPSGPTISILRLRSADGRKRRVFFGDLKISTEDYFRVCDLYQAEAEQRLQVAAAE